MEDSEEAVEISAVEEDEGSSTSVNFFSRVFSRNNSPRHGDSSKDILLICISLLIH